MAKKIEKQIKQALEKIVELKEEMNFYDEEQLRTILSFTLDQYESLLESNLKLIKKVSNKGVLNG